MKKINQILAVLFVLVVFNTEALLANNGSLNADNDWQLKKEESGVKFYIKIDSCVGSAQLYFKLRVENTNTNMVQVDYRLVPLDVPASTPVHGMIVGLGAGAIVEANCADANDNMKVAMLPPAATIADLIILCHVQ